MIMFINLDKKKKRKNSVKNEPEINFIICKLRANGPSTCGDYTYYTKHWARIVRI